MAESDDSTTGSFSRSVTADAGLEDTESPVHGLGKRGNANFVSLMMGFAMGTVDSSNIEYGGLAIVFGKGTDELHWSSIDGHVSIAAFERLRLHCSLFVPILDGGVQNMHMFLSIAGCRRQMWQLQQWYSAFVLSSSQNLHMEQ